MKKLLQGISFSWIRFALTIGIGIIQTPLLFNNLNKEELNFWYIFYSFGAFLQMADLGLVQTISRLIAYIDNSNALSKSEGSIKNLASYSIKQIYITALFSFFTILVLAGVGVFIIYLTVYYEKTNIFNLKIAFLIYVIGIIFNLLSNVPASMLIGYREVGTDSIIRSIAQIIYFAILLIFLPYYHSIVLVSLSFMLQNLGQLVTLHFAFYVKHRNIFKNENHWKELVKFNIAKQIYSQSAPLVINQLGGWLISQGNIFIVSIVVGADKVSDYAINQQIFTYIAAIALVMNQSIGPFIAKSYIQNKLSGLQDLFVNTILICLSMVGVLIIIQLSCGKNIITLWIGPEHFLGYTLSAIFGITTFLEVQHSVAGNFVWNTGSWPFNKWTLWAGMLTVILGYFLGNYYGLIGIALATLVSKLMTLNWYVLYFGLKRVGLTLKDYTRRIFSPLFLSLILTLSLVLYVENQTSGKEFSNIVIILLLSCLSSGVFLLFIGIFCRKILMKIYSTVILPRLKHRL
ncbi:lipopolysaccharide biosynthesis protein [Spirosoma flavum]|uniref:Lipopolysaccharide biosynthesis protein n=1 Tax=Spirosoma flavum TaxID=2048557 RepID=A0ABW6AEU6_9BACT